MKIKLPLYIPISFMEASKEEKAKICNGCGAKDGMKVPGTVWFLSIVFACQVHDWMFEKGQTLGDYYFSNIMFFWNMTAIVINGSNWFTMLPRMERVLKYFIAVMTKYGKKAFWADKGFKNKLKIITIKGEFV